MFILKKIIIISLSFFLSGCFGPDEFDGSNEESINKSADKMVESLPDSSREEFKNALAYFSIGGEAGIERVMKSAFYDKNSNIKKEPFLVDNLKVIDGLTGDEIIKKYRSSLRKDKVKKEKKEEERKKIVDLKKKAQDFIDSNEFEKALSEYEAISNISSGLKIAEDGIKETTKAMEEFTQKTDYINKIKITEFTTTRIDTYSNENIPAIRISLKNNGDRSLDKVKVVVYFKDKDGNAIFEESFHPVLVSKYSIGSGNKPLKPGYVKEMEKGKYYTLDSPLSDWQEGNAEAKIIDIKFTE